MISAIDQQEVTRTSHLERIRSSKIAGTGLPENEQTATMYIVTHIFTKAVGIEHGAMTIIVCRESLRSAKGRILTSKNRERGEFRRSRESIWS